MPAAVVAKPADNRSSAGWLSIATIEGATRRRWRFVAVCCRRINNC
jgi:hypothetical protein